MLCKVALSAVRNWAHKSRKLFCDQNILWALDLICNYTANIHSTQVIAWHPAAEPKIYDRKWCSTKNAQTSSSTPSRTCKTTRRRRRSEVKRLNIETSNMIISLISAYGMILTSISAKNSNRWLRSKPNHHDNRRVYSMPVAFRISSIFKSPRKNCLSLIFRARYFLWISILFSFIFERKIQRSKQLRGKAIDVGWRGKGCFGTRVICHVNGQVINARPCTTILW